MFESILFISSNVGSLFEYNRKLYLPWRKATSDFIDRKNASLIILTMQEFGGKNILAWDDADFFLKGLYEHFSSDYSTFVCFVDCDMKSENNFTALCTVFMARTSLNRLEFFDFDDNKYTGFEAGYHVHQLCQISGMALKIKFPIELFPNGKWSRKGYMINRLRFGGLYSIDVVNLHLIHDSNFFLLINSPTVFQEYRRRQLQHILETLDQLKSINTVLCGDFNFRTSLSQLLNSFDKEYTFESDQELSNNDTCVARDLSDRNV
uniref:Type I inositol 1,4,5-trisphosphate 5-phosphatase (Trinotate prediction) n=1 Tax=Henneguya salminicola TaxID=69463 RepID=A0A6G3MDP6_HENSL